MVFFLILGLGAAAFGFAADNLLAVIIGCTLLHCSVIMAASDKITDVLTSRQPDHRRQ